MPLPTPTTKLSALITTVDPTRQLIEGIFKTAGKAHIEVFNKPPAFRWPVVGEVWMVRQENGSWQLDNIWPSTNVFTITENPVTPTVANPGDLILNSATGVIRVEGSLDGSTDFVIDNSLATKQYVDNANLPIATVTSLPVSPIDGQIIFFGAGSGTVWQFRYNAGSASAYKWEFVGGSDVIVGPLGSITTASAVAVALTGGPTFTPPFAGDYGISLSGFMQRQAVSGGGDNEFISLAKNGTGFGSGPVRVTGGSQFDGIEAGIGKQRVNGLIATDTISVLVSNANSISTAYSNALLNIAPVRVG